MKFILMLIMSFNFSTAYASEDRCNSKKLCRDMDVSILALKKDGKSKANFTSTLNLAKLLSQKNCKVSGIKVKIPVWRACYDQGFKVVDGKVTENFKGVFSEKNVLDWFFTIKNSEFTDGQKFINSKEFKATLDGAYYCMFVQDESC